jgi:hypothetical protein
MVDVLPYPEAGFTDINEHLLAAVQEGVANTVRVILYYDTPWLYKLDVNAQLAAWEDTDMISLLHFAISINNEEIVRLLLDDDLLSTTV